MKKTIAGLLCLAFIGCANTTKQPKLSTILDRAKYIRQQGYSKDETYARTLSMFNEIYGYEHEKEAVKLFKKFASEKVDLSTPNKAVVVMDSCYATIAQRPRTQKDFISAIADGAWWVIKTTAKGTAINRNNPYVHGNTTTHFISQGGGLQVDAYGPGIHMNQYGQPVILHPDFGGVPGELLRIKPNAYGHGVHMDQYGRPVREYPWP